MFFNGKRVIYKNHQLETVTFQVNFNSILIEDNILTTFYNNIKRIFPIYVKPQEVLINGIIEKKEKTYVFLNEEDKLLLILSKDYLAISFKKYSRYEELLKIVELPLKFLESIFSVQYYNRVAIRYIDIFKPSKLGINNIKWEEYIKSEYLGFYNIKPYNIDTLKNDTYINIDDGTEVHIITGIGISKDGEKCFQVDSDFYKTQKIKTDNIFDSLNIIHNNSIGLLDEIITDKLRKILEPENV